MCYAVYLSPDEDWATQESTGEGKRFSIKTLNSYG